MENANYSYEFSYCATHPLPGLCDWGGGGGEGGVDEMTICIRLEAKPSVVH